MNITSFLVGFFFGLPLLILCLKLFKGKFMGVTNRYFAGTLYGLWIWLILILLLFVDAKYNLAGLVNSDQGFGVFTVIFSSWTLYGFLVSGLLAGFISAKMLRRKA